jgi:3,4-dihydroxy 2-butanone 4-phosphate synthase/GTP cyclohydrolase II
VKASRGCHGVMVAKLSLCSSSSEAKMQAKSSALCSAARPGLSSLPAVLVPSALPARGLACPQQPAHHAVLVPHRAGLAPLALASPIAAARHQRKVSCRGLQPGLLNLAQDRPLDEPTAGFDSIASALADLAQGKFVVVLDDESRENEGDLIAVADKVRWGILLPSCCCCGPT